MSVFLTTRPFVETCDTDKPLAIFGRIICALKNNLLLQFVKNRGCRCFKKNKKH